MVSYENIISQLPQDSIKTEFTLAGKKLSTVLLEAPDSITVKIISNLDHLVLHWGVGLTRPKDWKCPMDVERIKIPTNSTRFDDKAIQSKFVEIHPAFSTIELIFTKPTPLQLNFVIKRDDAWFNNSNANYSVALVQPDPVKLQGNEEVQRLADEIIKVETEYNSWTLMHRFKLCNEWLNRVGTDMQGLSYIYVWMRYSALRKLTWQRKFNTRPSELAASNQTLTFTITNLLKSSNTKGLVNQTVFLRGILSSMGKGGNNGQRIRDQILEIMHRNGIKEHDNYYEQWHQKLHNNTTPDDIGICEATIEFNKTNNLQRFYEVLSSHGITRERLRTFERPITMDPFYAPHLVNDLYSYLDLLKAVHGSTDLTQSVNSCRSFLPQNLINAVNDLIGSLNHWDKIGQMEKTFSVRTQLFAALNRDRTEQFRECLYLDMNLEAYSRQLCEEIIHLDIKLPHLCRELRVLVSSVQLTAEFNELQAAGSDFFSFFDRFGGVVESDKESAMILKAACDRLQRVLGTYVDVYSELIGQKSVVLGTAFGADSHFVDIFAEESIRGSLLFAVSMVLKKIDRVLRRLCDFQPWQIISPKTSVNGKFIKVDSLSAVAYEVYHEPTVLLCEKVTGEEEIPDNVFGVISLTELDALAHVCVRARNNKTLLAVLFDSAELASISGFLGKLVKVSMKSSGLKFEQIVALENEVRVADVRQVKKPLALEKVIIRPEEFGEGRTGAKANNCMTLKTHLPDVYGVPNSLALPYGTFEFVQGIEENSELLARFTQKVEELNQKLHTREVIKPLNDLKELVLKVKFDLESENLVKTTLESIGCMGNKWSLAWQAIKSVWASKYNERVLLSTLKAHISLNDVVMSVLCQEVISGQYAFVLHTKNPFSGNSEEIYAEVVLGLGETLVGAYEGRSLSFTVHKTSGKYEIFSFFSKSIALRGSGFIFRSDSNSEDLPGFAGAGLFDSFVMEEAKSEVLRYAQEPVIVDKRVREDLIRKLNEVGKAVEQVFGGEAQDIEGVISNGKVFVVQSRPQV